MRKLLTFLFLSGCALNPHTPPPTIPTPAAWKNAAPTVTEGEWWTAFGSAQLPALVDQALQQNADLEAATARIAGARAATTIAGAPLFPSVSGIGNAGRTYNDPTQNAYQGGLQAAYELDLFGKNRSAREAAQWQAAASAFDRQALSLSITAQTAQTYFAWLALKARIQVAQDNLKNAQEVLKTLRVRRNNGALSDLEVAQQETFVSNSQASLAQITQQEEIMRNALAVLLGQTPQTFMPAMENLAKLHAPAVAIEIPCVWLTRRPDIAQAEAQLKAANADIAAARAAFFPSVTLNATTALSAVPATAPAAAVSQIGALVLAPIFSGGAIKGGVQLATARQQELAANYRKVVLTAYAEAENALRGMETSRARVEALTHAVQSARVAYDNARVRFKAGAIDNITLLEVQRTLLVAQEALAQARADNLAASVDLYRAMGGDWKEAPKKGLHPL